MEITSFMTNKVKRQTFELKYELKNKKTLKLAFLITLLPFKSMSLHFRFQNVLCPSN